MLLTKLTWQAYKAFLARPIDELETLGLLNPSAQRRQISSRLLAQIHYFGSREDALPEWRDAALIRQPDDLWKIWSSLPIMTKDLLNSAFEPSEMQRRFDLKGRINMTGGSTGEPTRFFLDTQMLRASRGSQLYSRLKMGWRPGMPTVIIWGAERDIGRQSRPLYRLAHELYGDQLIPGFELTDDSIAKICNIIRAECPVAVYGYSSLLEHVAERMMTTGEQLLSGSVATAWNGGEMLYENQVQLFKRAFGVPILNRYGGRELSTIAFQHQEGGPLRVIRPWIFLEIVNDSGKPASPNEPGRLLLTSTISRGTPFLRYEIGDLGTFSDGGDDESGIHRITGLHGRHAGAIRLGDGGVVSSIYWNHLLKEYPEVRQFQVRVKPDGQLLLLLAGSGFSEAQVQQLRATLRVVWGDRPIAIEWTDVIPRSAQGKLIQVVHES